jgi:hypothetical protein
MKQKLYETKEKSGAADQRGWEHYSDMAEGLRKAEEVVVF